MQTTNSSPAFSEPVTHLLMGMPAQMCDCGHHALLHWHRPACPICGCTTDPLCDICGQLVSQHREPTEDDPL